MRPAVVWSRAAGLPGCLGAGHGNHDQMTLSSTTHGTRSMYVAQQCRCEPCRTANTTYHRNRQRALRRPDETWQPHAAPGDLAALLVDLLNNGWSLRSLSHETGLSRSTLRRALNGTGPVRSSTARRLLEPTRCLPKRLLPGTHTQLVLEAFSNAGWSKAEVVRICELDRYPRLRGERVNSNTAQAVQRGAAKLGVVFHNGELLAAPRANPRTSQLPAGTPVS